MADRRGETGHFAAELFWKELFARRARRSRLIGEVAHINVLEAQALLDFVQTLRGKNVPPGRVLVFIDSWVVLGAVGKGRSSSLSLNRVL